jgi:exo-1,4-beta-D-glucosaminidase
MFKTVALILLLPAAALAAGDRVELSRGWRLQSAQRAGAGGDVLSTRGFATAGWTEVTVPSTVVAAQVAAGQVPDPTFGKNLRSIPGTTYPIAENFANLPMPADSPYASSWWYRTEFRSPVVRPDGRVWLHFDGVNYRANVWLNGRKIADAATVAGTYRTYAFDVTDALAREGVNTLAVETFAPSEKDLAVTWVDWNPMPPDKNMGIWAPVYLTTSGPVTVEHPAVVTKLLDDALTRAELTVVADVHNATDRPIDGILAGTAAGIPLRMKLALAPGERKTVRFTPDDVPRLRVDRPRLWWPAPLGPQALETVTLSFETGGRVSDTATARVGLREITSELTSGGHRLFKINRRPILIRGAGWAPDMLLRVPSAERLRAELRYVRDMNLNAIRLEGKLESDAFYDRCDEEGILVMAGWCCCSSWEMWDAWRPGDLEVATASLRSQILRMRSHPSMLVWLNGSDNPPPAAVEKAYVAELEAAVWPNPYLSSATATPTTVTGDSGVKMNGPYDYVVPSYWLRDAKYGGAFGFATEIGPGPAIPTRGSLERMLGKEHLWPPDEVWEFHAGGGGFKNIQTFDRAMREIYGEPTGLDDYLNKAQAMAYDGQRAMFEAYGRNKFTSTGVIQWMLNNAWPSTIWHLYDYYLMPAGGYFGTKKACEPLHVQYSYDDRGIVVVNELLHAAPGLRASARVFDAASKQTHAEEVTLDANPNSASRALVLPATAFAGSGVHFVRLDLRNAEGKLVSTNFYWLPERYAEFAWDKTEYITTPISTYEDLHGVAALPRTTVSTTASVERTATGDEVRVRLRNAGAGIAFQLQLTVTEDGREVAPILWDDNYVSLLPGETRELTARFAGARGRLSLRVDGINVETADVALGRKGVR